mmetsp:Transcript_74592/g.132248  ORF Transcript_74592/g.132248 Transcript_74592/m.132248 type:complete len:403 (-) Transcript_74592:248-1456(-)
MTRCWADRNSNRSVLACLAPATCDSASSISEAVAAFSLPTKLASTEASCSFADASASASWMLASHCDCSCRASSSSALMSSSSDSTSSAASCSAATPPARAFSQAACAFAFHAFSSKISRAAPQTSSTPSPNTCSRCLARAAVPTPRNPAPESSASAEDSAGRAACCASWRCWWLPSLRVHDVFRTPNNCVLMSSNFSDLSRNSFLCPRTTLVVADRCFFSMICFFSEVISSLLAAVMPSWCSFAAISLCRMSLRSSLNIVFICSITPLTTSGELAAPPRSCIFNLASWLSATPACARPFAALCTKLNASSEAWFRLIACNAWSSWLIDCMWLFSDSSYFSASFLRSALASWSVVTLSASSFSCEPSSRSMRVVRAVSSSMSCARTSCSCRIFSLVCCLSAI